VILPWAHAGAAPGIIANRPAAATVTSAVGPDPLVVRFMRPLLVVRPWRSRSRRYYGTESREPERAAKRSSPTDRPSVSSVTLSDGGSQRCELGSHWGRSVPSAAPLDCAGGVAVRPD